MERAEPGLCPKPSGPAQNQTPARPGQPVPRAAVAGQTETTGDSSTLKRNREGRGRQTTWSCKSACVSF